MINTLRLTQHVLDVKCLSFNIGMIPLDNQEWSIVLKPREPNRANAPEVLRPADGSHHALFAISFW